MFLILFDEKRSRSIPWFGSRKPYGVIEQLRDNEEAQFYSIDWKDGGFKLMLSSQEMRIHYPQTEAEKHKYCPTYFGGSLQVHYCVR